MNAADLPDPRLRQLATSVQRTTRTARTLLVSMIDAPIARRAAIFQAVQVKLDQARSDVMRWASRHFPEFYDESLSLLTRRLERGGFELPAGGVARELAVNGLLLAFTERIDAAFFSLYTLASRLLRSTDSLDAVDPADRAYYTARVNAGVAPGAARTKALARFRERVLDRPATVIGASGKARHYDIAYYTVAVATSGYVQATNLAPRLLSQLADLDLVRVSSNPSMHGDYCDEYAGKVFSLSGAHPRFPALDSTPNGGPPFHPWCTHTLTLVMPWENLTDEEVVPDGALLQPGETSTARLERRSRSRGSRTRR